MNEEQTTMTEIKSSVILGITGRTDLLGSFSLKLLHARFIADYTGNKLAFDIKNTDLLSFAETGAKELYLPDDESQRRHLFNRIEISNALIMSLETPEIVLKQPEQNLLDIGFDKVIEATQSKIRDDVLRFLPKQDYINISKIIAIHFRSGEIVNIPNRYIHSSNYKKLIDEFKQNLPDKEIIIFTGEIPPKEIDDFTTFDGLRVCIEKELNELEIWRIFIEVDILVVARSGFSYTPALLRNKSQKTYYAKMWHPKLENWETWYDDGLA